MKRPYRNENLVMSGHFMNLPVILSPFLSSSAILQNCSNQLLLMILVENKVANQDIAEDAFLYENKTILPSPTCVSCVPDGEAWPLDDSSSSVQEFSEEEQRDDVDDDNELFSSKV